jgi:hypothetical protein
LKVLCDKFSHTRFEPSGWSGNPKIGYAKSLMDYVTVKFMWRTPQMWAEWRRFLEGEGHIS